ncbi:MAG: OmcA/MtrC family decaheme c-type cytochrome [Bryobacteraceae bacterium]
MKLNVLRPSGWCRRLGWFAIAAAMALCTLPVLGDTIPALPVTLVANPLPAGQDQTTLTWNAPNSTAVEVHVGSPTGTLFADGGPTGSAATGAWATLGMSFYLVDATTHQSLASAVIQQPGATLTASPNPLPDGVNQTTLTWNAPNSIGVEIHVGSATGPLFAEGGDSGSAATGPWADANMSFYLVDAATKESIASTTIQDPNATAPGALTPQDKAFYLTPDMYNFIRPGLTVTITGGSIAADGTMVANFTVTDMLGLPLDYTGVTTPGIITLRFVAATIPNGQEQYVSYIYTTTTTNGVTTTQAARDNGGVVTQVGSGVGTYTYTYKTKAMNVDPTATQTFGMYATRDLTPFDLGTQYSNSTFNFVQNGSPVTVIRDVVNTASCNACHDPLSAHGGSRQIVPLCVMCHQPQSTDPGSNNTVDFKVMIHKIHMGSSLPTVIAGQPYYFGSSPTSGSNFSTVVFPSDVRYCTQCHGPNATQSSTYKTEPTRAACGSCHDNVNFLATCPAGSDPNLCTNHPVVETDDSKCATCHQSKETTEFDLSVPGAHTIQTNSTQLTGVKFALASATGASNMPVTVNFSVTDNSGNPLPLSKLSSLSLVLASPTTDYAGYISESALKATSLGGANYTYTFKNPLPATASGSYTVGIEGYSNETIITNPHFNTTSVVRDAGFNQDLSFSVDTSAVVQPPTVVALANCDTCHVKLSAHGGIRNNTTHCVLCHNPNQTDSPVRPPAQNPPEAIEFRTLIHKIHRGTDLTQPYTIYGFGGSVNNFNGVLFPGDLRNCAKCHVNSSYQLPINQTGLLLPVVTPRSFINPTTFTETQSCVSCHDAKSISAHALLNTQAQLGESCDVCHGNGATYSVDAVHAR